MKKSNFFNAFFSRSTLFVSIFVFFLTNGCCKDDISCGVYNGRELFRECNGKCYYVDNNNDKKYVDASLCDCDDKSSGGGCNN